MFDILDIDIILSRKKYPKIYNIGIYLLVVILITFYIIFTYHYQTYYLSIGKAISNKLELYVDTNDLKYIKDNNIIELDNKKYFYKIDNISNNLYVDDNYNNYLVIYLNIDNFSSLDNYVYEVKIPKENKRIYKYLSRYL